MAGLLAIGCGIVVGILAIRLGRTARHTEHTRPVASIASLVTALAVSHSSWALVPSPQEGPPPLTPETRQPAMEEQERIRVERAERLEQFYASTAQDRFGRLVRDLQLTADQAELCLTFHDGYVSSFRKAQAVLQAKLEEWRKNYFASRLPPPTEDLSYLTDDERRELMQWRLAQGSGLSAPDGSYETARRRESARLRLKLFKPECRRAAEQMYESIVLVLSEEQLAHWERAKLRLAISLYDAMYPRTGGRPNWSLDLLGLVEDAASEGAELEPLRSTLLHPLMPEPGAVDVNIDARERIGLLLQRVENEYFIALNQHDQHWDDSYRYRAGGLDPSFPKVQKAERNWLRGTRSVWGIRLRFARDVKTLAAELLGDEAANNWERRFHARCSPWLFASDKVDVFIQGVPVAELDVDVREVLEGMIARYQADRRQLRYRTSLTTIELRGADLDEREAIQERFDELLNERERLEQLTLHGLRTFLAPHSR